MYQGKNLIVTLLDERVAELKFDAPGSANVLNQATLDELGVALTLLEQQEHLKGLLLTSGKRTFILGSDISEFDDGRKVPKESIRQLSSRGNNIFNRIQNLPYPTVAVINNFALGGGFEFCLACDFRVISKTAQVGLPEVKLGIIPGWGGCIRLPRLIGFEKAVDWVTEGVYQKAQTAFDQGAVDVITEADQLIYEAFKIIRACSDDSLSIEDRRTKKSLPTAAQENNFNSIISVCTDQVTSKAAPNYPAPITALNILIETASMNLEEGLEVEFEGFYSCFLTSQQRAMTGIFLNDKYVTHQAKQRAKLVEKHAKSIVALGAGIMGGGISYQNAIKGFSVLMKDINNHSLDQGMAEAKKLLSRSVKQGHLSEPEAETILARIKPTLEYDGVEDASIVIEAVVEDPKIKGIVLPEVERLMSPESILVSNTSTISIDLLAANLKQPEQFCGMHFFNPVHRMPLVEVIRGTKTSEQTVNTVVAHALAMGKKPIVVNDCPGFLVNRVLFPMVNGFDRLIADGIDFRRIDQVAEKWGWPMGPAYLMDVVGIDTAAHCLDIMAQGFPDRMSGMCRISATELMFKNERLGQKNGQGFYTYKRDERGKPQKELDEAVYNLLAQAVEQPSEVSEDDIIARYMLPLCTEMARCLEEGIVASPAEADMALVYGLGFPVFRGGVFRWMDETGIKRICEMADTYSHLGNLYEVTPAMREMASKGESYYS